MSPTPHIFRKSRATGFTLVEVLIALVVLAIGMLGIGAMLLNGLQSSRTALQRTQAVALASDLGDRIRANRAAGAAYALTAGTALSAPAKACATACTSAEVAALDLYRWQQSVVAALPGAQTAVVVNPVGAIASNRYTITITWTQSGDTAAASFALTVQA
jgi:type IV pilus assembly protein PilV